MNPHPQVREKLEQMTYSQARRYLKPFCTHGEQDELMHGLKFQKEDKKGWLVKAVTSPAWR